MNAAPSLAELYPDVTPDEHEAHTFNVKSSVPNSRRGPYRVFLDAYNWNGMCNCWDFDTRKRGQLERGAKPSDDLRCRHIKRARSYYMDEIGRLIDKTRKTDKPTLGRKSVCRLCKSQIYFNGQAWAHVGENRKHPALP